MKQNSNSNLDFNLVEFRQKLEFLPIPTFLFDSNQQILFINAAFCDLMGFSAKDLIPYLSKQSPIFEAAEWFIINAKGESVYFTAKIQALAEHYFIAYCTDITAYHNKIETFERSSQSHYLSTDIDFKDLFDIQELQKIQDIFSEATGISSVITYPNGLPITEPSNFSRFCELIRSTPKGLVNCFHSDSVLGCYNPKGASIQPCLSAGLLDGGASISVGGKHIANWLIGQVRNSELDEERIFEYAQEIGVDQHALREAYSQVPRMSKERFMKIADTLFLITNTLSDKAFQNILQARLIKDLEQTQKDLIVAKEKSEANEKNLFDRNSELLAAEEELRAANEELVSTADSLKETNEELRHAKVKAEESEHLKTSFLQNMSHEIRTPMNAIIGFSDMLKEDLSAESRKNFTDIIINSSRQLLSVVNDILTVSSIETKQEKIHSELACINSILVEMVAKFSPKAEKQNLKLYLKQTLSDKNSIIYTDEMKFRRILENLLSNALKFTHEGYVEFGYLLKETYLEFYVKDTGIGIENESHHAIFDRFRQADDSISKRYGGTGLGLSISKAFAELLGGEMWLLSECGKGSTFYFTLPYKSKYNENQEFTNQIQIQKEQFPTILVAEDEEYNFLYIEELLKKKANILHAKNGQEAIDLCKENPAISLVLMDIKMPTVNGFEANLEIKKFRPDLPIIAQTAYALQHDLQKIKDEGFTDCLTKPIHKKNMLEMLSKYIKL